MRRHQRNRPAGADEGRMYRGAGVSGVAGSDPQIVGRASDELVESLVDETESGVAAVSWRLREIGGQ